MKIARTLFLFLLAGTGAVTAVDPPAKPAANGATQTKSKPKAKPPAAAAAAAAPKDAKPKPQAAASKTKPKPKPLAAAAVTSTDGVAPRPRKQAYTHEELRTRHQANVAQAKMRKSSGVMPPKPKTAGQKPKPVLDNDAKAPATAATAAVKKSPEHGRRRTTTVHSAKCLDGRQLIVTCVHHDEGVDACRQQLADAHIDIIKEMHNTDYFVVCADNEHEAELAMSLAPEIADFEDDQARYLQHMPESRVDRALQQNEQINPYGLDLVKSREFWEAYGTRGDGVTVCVIDTGLFVQHVDIAGASKDGSNDIDLVVPWDEDGNSHGTHVAGTIAAQDNGVGILGVSPEVDLFIVRVFDDSGGFGASSLVEGMVECSLGGADIISMSLGGPTESSPERQTINELTDQGILLIAAAGNGGDGANTVNYPQGYTNCMGVGACDRDQAIAWFSTHNDQVSVSGPGVSVLSLTVENTTAYSEYDGTSMATPHVAGVAALLRSQFPDKSPTEIRAAMQISARDVGACGYDPLHGHGVVDAMAAAAYLESGVVADDQTECVPVRVRIVVDDWGAETTFIISSDDNGDEYVARGGPYTNGQRGETHVEDTTLPLGCYTLTMRDSYGDGMNSETHGPGEYELYVDGVSQIYSDSFTQGNEEVNSFCITNDSGNVDGNGNGDGNGTPSECGNGVVDDGEECDDGNTSNNDQCTNDCTIATCGDGYVQSGEECDDGNDNGLGGCTVDCVFPSCGDGVVEGDEECDDGNDINTDGCTNFCTLPVCGDGIIQPQNGEQCDDGNNVNDDYCTNNCQVSMCGDGIVQSGETCDDGNNADGDGCSSLCQTEGDVNNGSCGADLAEVRLILNTDADARNENELYLFDVNSPNNEFIWIANVLGIRSNDSYDLVRCINPSGCYDFYYLDSWGDGFNIIGDLTLTFNGEIIESLDTESEGEEWNTVDPNDFSVYWYRQLGSCA